MIDLTSNIKNKFGLLLCRRTYNVFCIRSSVASNFSLLSMLVLWRTGTLGYESTLVFLLSIV